MALDLSSPAIAGALAIFVALTIAVLAALAVKRQRSVKRDLEERLAAAERRLDNSTRRFEDVAGLAGDWFWEMDRDLRFTYISDRNVENMITGTIVAIGAIAVILMLALQSFRLGLISLIPNIEYVSYDAIDGAAEPDDDLMVRMTFFVKF